MIENLAYSTLQEYWWLIVSIVGSLLVFLFFIQGGQTLFWQIGKNEEEKTLMINSLGRKWELGFTTLVLFGGALFASFPLFYSASFGGAYYFWMLVLFSFVIQAVAYEYRSKPHNFLGNKTYEAFLFLNGLLGVTLLGGAVATFFSGSPFSIDEYRVTTWGSSWRGLEALGSFFNVSFGLAVFFLSRVLGAQYFINNIDHDGIYNRAKKCNLINFIILLPFLLYFLFSLITREGFAISPEGVASMVPGKYLANLLSLHIFGLGFLLLGIVLILASVLVSFFTKYRFGIWLSGLGTVLFSLSLFFTAGFKGTSFYPSSTDATSSLTIYNASSSQFTLTAMTYVSMIIPFVLAYIIYTWRQMNLKPMTLKEMNETHHY